MPFCATRQASTVQLGALIGGRPTILALGYFHCPNLCGVVRADLTDALAGSGLHAPADYSLIVLSIDPDETAADAADAHRQDAARMPMPAEAAAWHYLTGSADAVHAVEQAVGFRARFDPALRQFLHPAGLVILTAQRCRLVLSARRRLPARRSACGGDAGGRGRRGEGGIAGAAALLSLRSDDRALHARGPAAAAACRRPHCAHRRRHHRARIAAREAAVMRFSLPEASANAAQTDWLICGLTAVSFAVLALVFGLMLFYVVRYRHNSPIDRGALAEKTFRFEIAWTTATLLVFFGLFIWGSVHLRAAVPAARPTR